MLGEQHLRALSTTGACTVIVCAGMCHLARQYWVSTSTKSRREECALDSSKRRFVERMWSLVTQDTDTENDLVKDLGQADHLGVYTSTSAVNPLQTIYLRRAPSSGALGGFEWSVEKLVWLPTSTVLDDVLSIDHEILIRRLEAERLLLSSKRSMAQTGVPITHPPELDLPQSLKVPENIRGDVRVPQEFRCPLGSGVMSQPVVAPSGLTYDRAVIEQWVARFHTDPATGSPLQISQLYPNLIIRDLIQAWMVSNAHKLDPALVQRVTRDCTPGSYLATPVSEHTPIAFDRTSSFGLGPEHTSSVPPIEGIPSYGPLGALSAPIGAAPSSVSVATAATTAAALRGGLLQPSTDAATAASLAAADAAAQPLSTFSCIATRTPAGQQRKSEGGVFESTPATSDTITPVASLRHRRHSTALGGCSITTESLVPVTVTSQQEFSPMGASAFPAGLMCPSRHFSFNACTAPQDPRAASSSSLPSAQRPNAAHTAEDSAESTLAEASPLCCAKTEVSASTNALETGCDTNQTQHEAHNRAVDSFVAAPGHLEYQQQKLPPVKLPSRSSSGRMLLELRTDIAAGDILGSSMVASPGYQVPRSWDSDEMIRSTAGGVKLGSNEGPPISSLPPASAALDPSNDRAYQEELDRLIA